jgi:hypothetical protein
MAEDQRPGAVYWIDHYAVATNDLERWLQLMRNLVGARDWVRVGPVDQPPRAIFQKVTRYQGQDIFNQRTPLPASKGLGKGCPRYGYFVRPEELEQHLRRLDDLQVPHTDPARTSAQGQEGTVIFWEDPDHNQFEFWAPTHMPAGAMEGCGPLNVGRLSHAVFESRDLDRTTDFVTRFWNLDRIQNADVDRDVAAFALAGGRIVYQQTDQLGERGTRSPKVSGPHTALTLRHDEVMPAYERMWAALAEADDEAGVDVDPATLPAATALHGSLAGRTWKKHYGRGDDFFDWDMNGFHFVGGVSRNDMQTYRTRFMDHYVQQSLGIRVPSELLDTMEAEEARGDWADILG